MTNLDININFLIHKYANGTLTDGEAIYLAEWVKCSKQNAALFRATLNSIYSQSQDATPEAKLFCERLLKQEFHHSTRRLSNLRKVGTVFTSVMAVAMVLFAVAVLVKHSLPQDIAPIEVVADVVTPQTTAEAMPESEKVQYVAPANATRRVELSDGTTIILNQGSRITVYENYNKEERHLRLNGEAYFDVAKSDKRFTVDAGGRSYVVHGTSFNILSFEGDKYSIVTLHSGKLEAKVDKDSYMLDPGEELRFDDDAKTMSKLVVQTSDSIGWLDKRLAFTRLPLKYVASQMSRKYNAKIHVHGAVEDIVYTGELKNEDLATALLLLSKTSPVRLSVTEIDGEYYISKLGV